MRKIKAGIHIYCLNSLVSKCSDVWTCWDPYHLNKSSISNGFKIIILEGKALGQLSASK